MIRRTHETDESYSEALYSPCEAYRYGLARRWGTADPVLFVMLNPSTATELANDPTIQRCETRARTMGAGGVQIANLFAFRATRPAELRRAPDPVGPENDALLAAWAASSVMTIAAWGVHGTHLGRDEAVLRHLGPLWHLGLTKAGHPRHPLYVPYAREPERWRTATPA